MNMSIALLPIILSCRKLTGRFVPLKWILQQCSRVKDLTWVKNSGKRWSGVGSVKLGSEVGIATDQSPKTPEIVRLSSSNFVLISSSSKTLISSNNPASTRRCLGDRPSKARRYSGHGSGPISMQPILSSGSLAASSDTILRIRWMRRVFLSKSSGLPREYPWKCGRL